MHKIKPKEIRGQQIVAAILHKFNAIMMSSSQWHKPHWVSFNLDKLDGLVRVNTRPVNP